MRPAQRDYVMSGFWNDVIHLLSFHKLNRPEPFPGPNYRLCEDPECPVAYAYRAPHAEVPHWHYCGGHDSTVWNG